MKRSAKKNRSARFPLSPLIAGLCLAALLALLPVREDASLYGKLIRLHVLADSDSGEDQALKLKVRDALLPLTAALTENCSTREEAEAVLRRETDTLRRKAEETLRENGCAAPVTVTVSRERYPTRSYEGLRLPAGTYSSLRVMIGKAEGRNWWCVLFPPLCVKPAVSVGEELISAGLTPDQVRILTDSENPRFVLRFKLLEIFGSLFS